MKSFQLLAALLAACALTAANASGLPAKKPGPKQSPAVVMSGLDNPRHLAFGPEGALYVAEAGRGGPGPCIFLRGETQCAGNTGAVSRLKHGKQKRIATGFPSYAPAGGAGATGPHAISLHGRGGAFVTIGLGGEGDPIAFRAVMGQGFGRTARLHPNGKWRFKDDLARFEFDNNPDHDAVPDSNPYGILVRNRQRVVVDSGGNDLLKIRRNGRISTLAVFPSRPQGRSTDSVPTSVKVGPDGAYYVGELTGGPFPAGEARVYRVDPPHAPTVYLSGFTAIIDIAWGPDGRLYVLQFATGTGLTGPGVLIRVNKDGTRTPVVTGLIAPGGVVFGRDGAAYISNKSVLAGAGEVVRFKL